MAQRRIKSFPTSRSLIRGCQQHLINCGWQTETGSVLEGSPNSESDWKGNERSLGSWQKWREAGCYDHSGERGQITLVPMPPLVARHQDAWLPPGLPALSQGSQCCCHIPKAGGNLKRHRCQTQSPMRELLIGLASVMCLTLAVSILGKQVSSSLPECCVPSHQDRNN